MRRFSYLLITCSISLFVVAACDNSRSCEDDGDCFAGESCIDTICVPEAGNNGGNADTGTDDTGESDSDDTSVDDGGSDDAGTNDAGGDDAADGDAGTTGPSVIDIETGERVSCALFDNGEVFCWGFNENDLLNIDSTLDETPYPTKVQDVPAATAIEVGSTTACALSESGEVWCWGENWGFVSGEDDRAVLEPTTAPFSGVAEFRMGATGGCALLDGRRQLVCWGNVPAAPDFENTIVDFAAGSFHACAVIEGGDVRCWGSEYADQVGVDDPIRGVSDVAAIDAARSYNCAVKTDGTVWCWGDNTYGNLGTEDQSDTDIPVEVPLSGTATDVVTGSKYACAIFDNGGVKCWGEFRDSDGAYELFHEPMTIYPLVSGVVDMDTGDETSCALQASGDVWCWGDNNYEQLGNDGLNTTSKGEPARVQFD